MEDSYLCTECGSRAIEFDPHDGWMCRKCGTILEEPIFSGTALV